MFSTFLQQGFTHILNPGGADHILFLFAICAIYRYEKWKRVLWIVTSFTLAHSCTLALSVLNIINIPGAVVEFLIATTIAFTCIENLFLPKLHNYRIIFSGFFGLVHGLGFSYQLKSLFAGMEFSVWNTLLPFNLGLEAGQIVIISGALLLITLLNRIPRIQPKHINYLISVPILIQALWWMWERR
jgi:hydrogenase/urease accessory protein HupE